MLGFDSINAQHTNRSMMHSCCICSSCPPTQLHYSSCHVSNSPLLVVDLCCLLPNPLCPLRCPPKASTLHSWQAQRGRVHAVALSPDETLVATAGPLLGPPGTGTGAGTGAGAGAGSRPSLAGRQQQPKQQQLKQRLAQGLWQPEPWVLKVRHDGAKELL